MWTLDCERFVSGIHCKTKALTKEGHQSMCWMNKLCRFYLNEQTDKFDWSE